MGDEHNDFTDQRHHFGKSVTFDQFDTTNYLHADVATDTSFVETMILQVYGFELKGSPVDLPGFGTHYGMYFLIDGTGNSPPGAQCPSIQCISR